MNRQVVHVHSGLASHLLQHLLGELLEGLQVVADVEDLEVDQTYLLTDGSDQGHGPTSSAWEVQHCVRSDPGSTGGLPEIEGTLVNIDEVPSLDDKLPHLSTNPLLLLEDCLPVCLLPLVC